jgi:putative tryptophan/tyrosine transport system substrate-binding protein
MIDRRLTLVVGLALALLAAPLAIAAQPPAKVPRIGYLSSGSTTTGGHLREAFLHGLRELGYTEGKNIAIEYRWAEGQLDRLPQLAAELVQQRVQILVAAGAPAIVAAQQATTTIPIVMASGSDVVGLGLVASLARPGGNITGLSYLAEDLIGKLLELLKAVVPETSRVAVLWNPLNPLHAFHASFRREIQTAAQGLGVTLLPVEARSASDLEGAFAAMARERAGALIVPPDSMTLTERKRVVDLAAKHRLPAIYGFKEQVEDGGLMAYGASASRN